MVSSSLPPTSPRSRRDEEEVQGLPWLPPPRLPGARGAAVLLQAPPADVGPEEVVPGRGVGASDEVF